jgi:hypothetical protein
MKSGVLIIAIVLIAIGVVSLAYQGITYTTREKIIDLGPIKATADKEKTIPLPPILGGLALAGGVVLLVVGARRERGGLTSPKAPGSLPAPITGAVPSRPRPWCFSPSACGAVSCRTVMKRRASC